MIRVLVSLAVIGGATLGLGLVNGGFCAGIRHSPQDCGLHHHALPPYWPIAVAVFLVCALLGASALPLGRARDWLAAGLVTALICGLQWLFWYWWARYTGAYGVRAARYPTVGLVSGGVIAVASSWLPVRVAGRAQAVLPVSAALIGLSWLLAINFAVWYSLSH